MPYICLANSLIPDGTVQVLDLVPNASQRNTAVDPPAQTKYVNRVQNGVVLLDADGKVLADAQGLSAYLVDHVQVGGLLQAQAVVTCANVADNDTITIAGVVFKAAVGSDFTKAGTALDPILFAKGNGGTGAATGLKAALDDAAVVTLLKTALGGDKFVTATILAGPNAHKVVLQAVDGAAALLGHAGNAVTVTSSSAAHLAIADLAGNTVTRLVRTTATNVVAEFWTPALQAAASAALIAKVDAGEALTLAAINVSLLASCGAELTNAGGSASTGTVANVLSIMAGRGYLLPAHPFESLAWNTKFSNAYTWSNVARGAFTRKVRTHDGFSKTYKGSDNVVEVEVRPIRATYDSGSLQISLAQGHLYHLTAGATTLWPDLDLVPDARGPQAFPTVPNARVVTVYGDDGSVLA